MKKIIITAYDNNPIVTEIISSMYTQLWGIKNRVVINTLWISKHWTELSCVDNYFSLKFYYELQIVPKKCIIVIL